MLLKRVAVLAILVAVAFAEEQPKYGGNYEQANLDYLRGDVSPLEGEQQIGQHNNTNTFDSVIDSILNTGRQGRNLDGFDEVYSDPTVQEAIQKGDDRQARNVIKDKLCSLGLMDCEEQIEGKRPFLPPGELIYSQPPNGYRRPPPNAVPNGAYGPPRPMPPPGNGGNKYGPPRKVGYSTGPFVNRPPGPVYVESKPPGPFYDGPSPPGPIYGNGNGNRPGTPQIFEGPKPPGPIFEDNSSPYKYDSVSSSSYNQHEKFENQADFQGPKPQYIPHAPASQTSSSGSSVNIHHHYHHIDQEAAKGPTVIVNNPVPLSQTASSYISGNSLGTSSEFSSNNLQTGGFSPVSSGFDYNKKQVGSADFNQGNGVYAAAYKPIVETVNSIATSGPGSYDGTFNSYGGAATGSNSGFSGNSGFTSGSNNGFNSNGGGFTSAGSNGYIGGGGSNSNGGLYTANAQYGQSASGAYTSGNQNSFHSTNPGFYKKALNTNGGGANSLTTFNQAAYSNKYNPATNSLSGQYNTGENYQGFESLRQESVDCVCVPYEQCPSQDVIGRKDDLILPLDPRNLKTDIEALEDEVVVTNSNGTMTTVRVTKEATEDKKSVNDDSKSDEAKKSNEEPKKVVKREAAATSTEDEQKTDKSDDIDQADGEARFIGLGSLGAVGGGGGVYGGNYGGNYGYGGVGGIGGKKVLPTFGVSFGLPVPSGAYNGYPLNPYGGSPAQNPYFGSISPNGLNLGLVNVNPLVSFQLSKNEHGEKLFKPLVNLHVTPNANIVQQVGNLLKAKKFGSQQGSVNQHYHTHTHYPNPPEIYHPHHYEGPPHHHHEGPPHHHGGPHEYYPSGSGGYPSNSGYPTGPSNGGYGYPNGYYRDSSSASNDDYSSAPPTAPQQYDPLLYSNQNMYENNNQNDYSNQNGYNSYQNDYSNQNDYTNRNYYSKNANTSILSELNEIQQQNPQSSYTNYNNYNHQPMADQSQPNVRGAKSVSFPNSRRKKRSTETPNDDVEAKSSVNRDQRQAYYQQQQQQRQCGPRHVCCRRPANPSRNSNSGQCGRRNTNGITGRIKNPVYVDGDSEFGEYPWQVAILKKDPKESVYVCGGTLIDGLHILTAAHCVKTYTNFDLRVRLGEWDVNHDVEFFPYIERDVVQLTVHPEYYAGTLDNDLAILRLNSPVDFNNNPHVSPACLPDKFSDFTGARCWTTGWGKDAFGDFGKYQNILKEVDVPIIGQQQCQQQLRNTRLGYSYKLNPGFICAGGEEGKDACKGDGGGPMVCERGGVWQLVGIVSWGIGCGQVNVPGVYVRVSHYVDWIQQNTHRF